MFRWVRKPCGLLFYVYANLTGWPTPIRFSSVFTKLAKRLRFAAFSTFFHVDSPY